jgi:hypothetical protein
MEGKRRAQASSLCCCTDSISDEFRKCCSNMYTVEEEQEQEQEQNMKQKLSHYFCVEQ